MAQLLTAIFTPLGVLIAVEIIVLVVLVAYHIRQRIARKHAR